MCIYFVDLCFCTVRLGLTLCANILYSFTLHYITLQLICSTPTLYLSSARRPEATPCGCSGCQNPELTSSVSFLPKNRSTKVIHYMALIQPSHRSHITRVIHSDNGISILRTGKIFFIMAQTPKDQTIKCPRNWTASAFQERTCLRIPEKEGEN